MSNIALQVERSDAGSIEPMENVIFEEATLSVGNISYNSTSGAIMLFEAGQYIISWWVASQASLSTNGTVFGLFSSQGDVIESASSVKTGEVSGIGVINVMNEPVTFWLRNTSTGTFYYAPAVPRKASLVVSLNADISAFGALYSEIGTLSLPANTPVTIPMSLPSNVSWNINYFTTNAITIEYPGAYQVNIYLSGNTLVTTNVVLSLNVNGVPDSILTQSLEFTADDRGTTFALTNYIWLTAGDVLTLEIGSSSATLFSFPSFGVGANLSVLRVS